MLLTPTCQGRSYAHYTTWWCFKNSGMSKINIPEWNSLATTLWRHTRKAINKSGYEKRRQKKRREMSEKQQGVRSYTVSGRTHGWVCRQDCFMSPGSNIQMTFQPGTVAHAYSPCYQGNWRAEAGGSPEPTNSRPACRATWWYLISNSKNKKIQS